MKGILYTLNRQHLNVLNLLGAINQTKPSKRAHYFEQAAEILDRHARIEEEIFYPALQNRTGRSMAAELAEHADAKRMLGELRSMADKTGPEFLNVLATFRGAVASHIRDEEADIFPLATGSFTDAELMEMYERARMRGE
jgi:hemerythrin-like domain-containing protein